jgi:hypothetical protein
LLVVSFGARAAPSAVSARTAGVQNPAVAVYQQNGASVVNITSMAVLTGLGFAAPAQPQGIGWGFFIDTDGQRQDIQVTLSERPASPNGP